MNSPITFTTEQQAILDALYKIFLTDEGTFVTNTELTTILDDYATKVYADNAASTAESNANSYTDIAISNIDNTISTLQTKFNVNNNNNDTGNVYSGTLNGESGTILFTGVILPNEARAFTIGNTSCTSSSKITDLGLIGVGDVVIGGYVPASNAFVVTVRNNSASPTANIRITFRVNN